MLTTLEMARAEFGFYAAHIALYNGEVEPRHRHTFQVALRVSGQPDTSGIVAEFSQIKPAMRDAVRRCDVAPSYRTGTGAADHTEQRGMSARTWPSQVRSDHLATSRGDVRLSDQRLSWTVYQTSWVAGYPDRPSNDLLAVCEMGCCGDSAIS